MTIEEPFHVTFDETNPKFTKVEVFNYARIVEKALLEDQDPGKNHNKEQSKDKYQVEDKYNVQV